MSPFPFPVIPDEYLWKTPDGRRPIVEGIEMDTRSDVGRKERSEADMAKADEEMRKRYGPDWKRPEGYTWHHKNLQGTKCDLGLYSTAEHDRYPHTGPRAKLDNQLGLPRLHPESRKQPPGLAGPAPQRRKAAGKPLSKPPSSTPSPGAIETSSWLRMPKIRGALSGTAPAWPLIADLAGQFVNDLSGGRFGNLLDNTLGSDPTKMFENMNRLTGPDAVRHWDHIFEKYGQLGPNEYESEYRQRVAETRERD